MSLASLYREPMDGIPTGRYCDGWWEVWRATDPDDPEGDGAYVWARVMSRIDDRILDCPIYFYKSHIEAERGEKAGGSGFLYELPFGESNSGHGHLYAVSNWHVVSRAPVIRLNSVNAEEHQIIRLKKHDWTRHPDQQTDIAVTLLPDDPATYRYQSISPEHLVTKDRIAEYNIGIGEDTFAVGRFVNHDGKQRNQPSVRFGVLAQMPKEKIKTETGDQEAFLVELKSIAGYSGSPVFALISEKRSANYRTIIESMKGNPAAKLLVQAQEARELFMFLGIDCGHIIDKQPVYNADGEENGQYIKSNTGMAIVIVPWKLTELLESEPLKKQREEAARKRRREIIAVEDFADQSRKTQRTRPKQGEPVEIPVLTRDEFFRNLAKATRRKKDT